MESHTSLFMQRFSNHCQSRLMFTVYARHHLRDEKFCTKKIELISLGKLVKSYSKSNS